MKVGEKYHTIFFPVHFLPVHIFFVFPVPHYCIFQPLCWRQEALLLFHFISFVLHFLSLFLPTRQRLQDKACCNKKNKFPRDKNRNQFALLLKKIPVQKTVFFRAKKGWNTRFFSGKETVRWRVTFVTRANLDLTFFFCTIHKSSYSGIHVCTFRKTGLSVKTKMQEKVEKMKMEGFLS